MCGEIHLRSIPVSNLQPVLLGEFLSQHANHVPVELDSEDLGAPLEQRVRQRTEARSKLDDLLAQGHGSVRNLGCGAGLKGGLL
jgi:hypothetical protein